MSQFKDKRVLITGAASGLGRLMAEKIATIGAELVLWDINEDSLNELCNTLQSKGYKAAAYKCNLNSKDEIQQVAEAVLKQQGTIDILINNAGVVAGKSLLDNTDEEIELMFNVNTLAGIHLIRAFLPAMLKQQQGHIVFIASAAALCATSRLVVYSATKYAMRGVEEALHFEIKRLGYKVKTSIVFPYYFDTGLFAGVKTSFPLFLPILSPQKVAERIVKAVQRNQQRVFIPRFVYVAILAKIFPVRIFHALAELLGINRSMNEFRGRSESPNKIDKS